VFREDARRRVLCDCLVALNTVQLNTNPILAQYRLTYAVRLHGLHYAANIGQTANT